MARRVLVTGAGGFLGRSIAELLLGRGDDVRGLARSRYADLESAGVEMLQGDIRDADDALRACEGMDAVIHTAAVAGIWGSRGYFFSINTEGTRQMLRASRQTDVNSFVYCSSPSVTFGAVPQVQIDESAPYPSRWLCHYPHSKALAEQAVLQANGQGLATCALRPHLIWGPRDPHLVPRLIEKARSGQLRIVGDGRNLVDNVYVDNAAQAHVRALHSLETDQRAAGKAYFISQGEPVNCWNWINQILKMAGLPPVQRRLSYRLAWHAGHLMEWVWRITGRKGEPRMTRFLAAQLAQPHYFDISAARRDFGYAPHVSSEEGMDRLQHWLQEGMSSDPTGGPPLVNSPPNR